MRIKWACLTLLLGMAAPGLAADYELVVPNIGSNIKNSPVLVVYPNGSLGEGDRIVSVRFGGGKPGSIQCMVEGKTKAEGKLLAHGPEVGEFVGKVFLGEGSAPSKAVGASLIEVPPGAAKQVAAAAKAAAKEAEGVPVWVIWAGAGVGLSFLLLFVRSQVSGRRTSPTSPIGPSRRSSVGDMFAELQSKLEQLAETQHELVSNPPGAKEAKKKLTSIEDRLSKLESAAGVATQSASKLTGSIAALERRLIELHESQKSQGDQVTSIRQMHEVVKSDQAANFKATSQELSELKKSLMDAISDSYARYEATIDAISKKIEEATNRITAIEAKKSATPSDLAPLAQGLKDLAEQSKASLSQLDIRVAELRSAIETTAQPNEVIVGLEERLNEISAKFENVESKISELPAHVDNNEPLVGRLDELAAKFNDIETKLDRPEPEPIDLEPLSVRLEVFSERLAEFEAQIAASADLPVELEPLSRRVEDLFAKMTEVSKRLDDAQQQSGDRESVEALAIRVAELQERVELAHKESPQTELLSQRISEIADQLQALDIRLSRQPSEPQVHETASNDDVVEVAPTATLVLETSNEMDSDLDDVEEPELVTPKGWSSALGSPEGRSSAEFHRGLRLSGDAKPNLLHPVDSPIGTSPVGAPIAYGRRLLYTHGPTIRGFWPGREDRGIALPESVPPDDWRLIAHESLVYCVGESSVHVGDLNAWARKTTFPGTFFAQSHTADYWVGAFDRNGHAYIDYRTPKGDPVTEPVALELPSESLMLASSGHRVFAYGKDGNVVLAEGDALHHVGSFNGRPIRVCRHKDSSLALVERTSGFAIELLADNGKIVLQTALSFEPEPEAFVAMGSRLYLFDREEHQFIAIDLKKMEIAQQWSSRDVSRVRKLSGIQSARAHFLAVVGASGEKNTGRAFVVDVKTGSEYKLCEVLEPHVSVIPVDSHVAVVTRCSYQNIVRVFAPFDSGNLAKAA